MLFGAAHYFPHQPVRLTEWHSALGEVIGQIGGEQRGLQPSGHLVRAQLQGGDHSGHHR